ncbi:amine receptor [Asbolus verrucosus]|uniref:Amine receptor n=1 Tax=Asbolus verrucosus TaxID=1661398 RepID=A0A482VNN5_ASBVE|nr:amine receptor [Asbolus verrucosus]
MHHKTTILVAPALYNSSCTHPRYSHVSFLSALGPGDVLQAFIVLLLTVGILAANVLLILVINSRRYSKYIHSQPRYLLTSLASNDLAMGLLVTPFAIVPSLRHCWPYGELVCQIQALLRGAISQQSAVILICMAMDRYLCMLHPARYHKHSSKKVKG